MGKCAPCLNKLALKAGNKKLLKLSVRRTYQGSRSKRNFEARKNRAMAKGKIIITPPPEAPVLQPSTQSPQKVVTGFEKYRYGCVSLIILIFFTLFFLIAGERVGLICGGLAAGTLLMGLSMFVHGRENGKMTEGKEYKLGAGLGLLIGAITFGGIAFTDFADGFRSWFVIPSLLSLIIGVAIFFNVWESIK